MAGAFQAMHRRFKMRLQRPGAGEQVLFRIGVEGPQRGGAGQRVARIGIAVEELDRRVRALQHRVVDVAADAHRAHGHGGVGHALGHADHVRLHAEPLRRKGRADPAKARDHLVEDEEDVVFGTDGAQALQVPLRRGKDAGRPGHRLDDHRGDGGGVVQGDDLFQRVGVLGPMLGQALGEGVAGKVVGVRQVVHLQQVVEVHPVLGQAPHGDAAKIDAVIAPLAPDQPGLVPLAPRALVGECDLKRRIHGLRARVGEEHMVKIAGEKIGDPPRRLEGQRVGEVEGRREVHLRRLPLDLLHHLGAGVTGVDAPQPRRAVQEPAPVRRLVVHVLGPGEQARVGLEPAVRGERDPEGGQVVGQGRVHERRSG